MARSLSVREAADYVGISMSMLNDLRTRGGGPLFLKLGRRVLYDPTDLDRWKDSKKYGSTASAKRPGGKVRR